MFDLLDDDAAVKVLSYLTPESLARFACCSRGCRAIAQQDACWASHVNEICSKPRWDDRYQRIGGYGTAASDVAVDEWKREMEDVLTWKCWAVVPGSYPEYNGPPLRMPYLTPYTIAETKKKRDAFKALPHEQKEREGGWDKKFPRWRVVDGTAQTQYLCFPTGEAKLCPLKRHDVWVDHAFPEMNRCGVHITSLEQFEVYLNSWRHYEEHEYDGKATDFPETIDPRKLDGQAAFDAMPKHEGYGRMQTYVDFYNSRIKRHLNMDTWTADDRKNMESFADFANLNFAAREPGEYDDTDDGEDEIVLSAEHVAQIIVGYALETFKEDGPYGEVHGVPYVTPFDLCFGSLSSCDPCGGSTSERQFLETLMGG